MPNLHMLYPHSHPGMPLFIEQWPVLVVVKAADAPSGPLRSNESKQTVAESFVGRSSRTTRPCSIPP